jgi:hypothetical protein
VYIYELFFAALAASNQTNSLSDFYQYSLELIKALSNLVLAIFGFIGLVTLGIIILGVLVTYLFIQYPPLIFDSISKVGIYHKLIRKEDIDSENCCKFGETRLEKIWMVFKHNFWIANPLFLTLLFLFNTFTSTSIPSIPDVLNYSVNSTNSSSQTPSSANPIDIPFFLSLSIVPAFLLSLRILANPTRKGVITFEEGRFSEFSTSLVFVINLARKRKIPEEMTVTSDVEIKKKIRGYKEQVISFYFSFVGSTLILFFLFVFLQIEKSKGTYDLISAFSPTMDPIVTVLLFIAEIPAIFIITILGELYLEWAEPIDQI